MLDVAPNAGAVAREQAASRSGEEWTEDGIILWCLNSPLHHSPDDLLPHPPVLKGTLGRFRVSLLFLVELHPTKTFCLDSPPAASRLNALRTRSQACRILHTSRRGQVSLYSDPEGQKLVVKSCARAGMTSSDAVKVC